MTPPHFTGTDHPQPLASDGTLRGQKQPGAGRAPGGRFTRAQALEYGKRRSELAQFDRENCPPAILYAIALMASLIPVPEVSQQTGITIPRLRGWLRRYPAEVAAAESAIRSSANAALEHLQPLAVKALTAALLSETPSRQQWGAEMVAKYRWPRDTHVPGGLQIEFHYESYVPEGPSSVRVIEHVAGVVDQEQAETSSGDDGRSMVD